MFGKGHQCIFKHFHRRAYQPRAHLPHTRISVRDAGIDPRCDTRFHYLADINAGWRTAKVQRRDGEVLVLGVVISYISSVVLMASLGVPLTKVTIAGAAAMAKPPMPAVSVIVLSPMSRMASSAVKPGK